MEDIDPYEDGVTHINVYSKGNTEIGRLLSNFAHTPFTHPKYGHFESVEGLWYYLSSGCQGEELRELYGFEAKKVGRQIMENIQWSTVEGKERPNEANEEFIEDIKEGIRQKLRENRDILNKLCKTQDLPLVHYYVYYGKHKDEEGRRSYKVRQAGGEWMMKELESIRRVSNNYLRQKEARRKKETFELI